jgi:hypothetical protein
MMITSRPSLVGVRIVAGLLAGAALVILNPHSATAQTSSGQPTTTQTVTAHSASAPASAASRKLAASSDSTTRPVTATPGAVASVATSVAANPSAAKPTHPYYIEFRSRSAQSYGHTFSIFGRLNAQGKIVTKEVAGLHPFTESAVPWMVGHLVLVPSETGASDGDTEDEYVTARFRVALTQAEYSKVVGFIRQLKAKSPVWHAVLYNCNAFVGDIARFMGFETPGNTMLFPEEYISSLRNMNLGRQSANFIGTPVRVEDAAALRAAALREKTRGTAHARAGSPRTTPVAIQNAVEGAPNQSW